jgi:hypothetical protein
VPTVIDRQRVIGLFEENEAQLVEVLPAGEYQEERLPAAVGPHLGPYPHVRDRCSHRSISTG